LRVVSAEACWAAAKTGMTIAVHKTSQLIRAFDRDMASPSLKSLLVTGAPFKMTEVTIEPPIVLWDIFGKARTVGSLNLNDAFAFRAAG
jgi:hypothetical protein